MHSSNRSGWLFGTGNVLGLRTVLLSPPLPKASCFDFELTLWFSSLGKVTFIPTFEFTPTISQACQFIHVLFYSFFLGGGAGGGTRRWFSGCLSSGRRASTNICKHVDRTNTGD